MGKRKRAEENTAIFHYTIEPDLKVIREYLEKKRKSEEPPSSSVAAPRVFEITELLTLILSYLSPQDLLRIQRVNEKFHQTVNSRDIQQKLFFAPNQNDTQIAWNPLRRAAIPEWFGTVRIPMRAGTTRILTYYDVEDGQHAIRSSRDGKNASWRRMLICQPALISIHVLHEDATIERRTNLKLVTMGDVHDEIEFVRSHKTCPRFQYINFACERYKQGLELKILLV
jgi:hypothetical protein